MHAAERGPAAGYPLPQSIERARDGVRSEAAHATGVVSRIASGPRIGTTRVNARPARCDAESRGSSWWKGARIGRCGPDEIGREIERAGFRTSACRVRQNDWWDHLILVALTDDD